MCADVVVVGGGPVGCWTAIQLKKRNPALVVQIYERHPEYQRDHMMSIRRSSLLRYSKITGDTDEKAFFGKIAAANNAAAPLDDTPSLRSVNHIRTKAFEKILKDQCAALGINFTYERINSPEEVMARHPECLRFIAADGAHSAMREALLGKDSVISKDLIHSVDVKYSVEGQAQYLREPTYDKMKMIVVETIGKEEEGKTQVALRFLVDPKTYNAIPEATFKKPLNLMELNDGYDAALFGHHVREFQRLRRDYAGDKPIRDSEQITKIKLSQYASKKFAVTKETFDQRPSKEKAAWFFVGDAAMGMPFYRSINSGLMQGSQLAAILSHDKLSPSLMAGFYNATRPFKLAREFGTVAAKTQGLTVYKYAVRPALRGLAFIGIGAVALPIIGIAAIALKLNPRARLM